MDMVRIAEMAVQRCGEPYWRPGDGVGGVRVRSDPYGALRSRFSGLFGGLDGVEDEFSRRIGALVAQMAEREAPLRAAGWVPGVPQMVVDDENPDVVRLVTEWTPPDGGDERG